MGITPITSLTPLSAARSLQADLDPLPMARAEQPARTGDETCSPSDRESAGGSEENSSEDEGSEDVAFEGALANMENEDEASHLANEDCAGTIPQPGDGSVLHPISFFA